MAETWDYSRQAKIPKPTRPERRTLQILKANIQKLPIELKLMVLDNLPGGYETPRLHSILFCNWDTPQVGTELEMDKYYRVPFALQINSQVRASYATKFYSQTTFIFRMDEPSGSDWMVAWLRSLTDEHRNALTAVRLVRLRKMRCPPTWATEMPHPIGDTVEFLASADESWGCEFKNVMRYSDGIVLGKGVLQFVDEVYEEEAPEDCGEDGHPHQCSGPCFPSWRKRW